MTTNAFITNSKSRTLKKRLDELIQHSKELKFLVGYFYFSGWRELYESLKSQNDLTIKLLKTSEVSKTSEVWKAYKSAHEETMSVTEGIVKVSSTHFIYQ